MGIRKSQGKNKKSTKPTAITVKREETLKRAARPSRGKARPA